MLKQPETPPENPLNLPVVTKTSENSRYFWLVLAALVVLAAVLRLYGLGDYPQVFNQDEMVMGYDAWSVWTTGRDQHGNAFPIHFRTFNDSVPPVANYLTMPFVGLLGLSRFSTVLAIALLGIATIWLVGLLARRWWGAPAGLIAALLLALEPWHITYSRIAFPAGVVPFFITAALYCFTRGFSDLQATQPRRQSYLWLAGSALSFGILAATYTPLKLEAPLLIGAVGLAGFGWFWRHRLVAFGWLAFIGLCASPLLYSQLRYWDQIQVHFKQLSILGEPGWFGTFLTHYFNHYNPINLFIEGFYGGITSYPTGVGELFWLEGFLWVIAAGNLWRQRQTLKRKLGFSLSILLAGWFLTFPISASLTNIDIPHEIRAYNFVPLPELLAAFGAVTAWQYLSRWRIGARFSLAWPVAALSGLLFLVFASLFTLNFFGPPLLETNTPVADLPYNLGLEPVLQELNRQATPCDSIWIEPSNETYIYYLFNTHYPPAQFQKADVEATTQKGGWLYVLRLNNIHFDVPGRAPDHAPALPQCQGQPSRLFFVDHSVPTGPEWREVSAVRNKAGEAVWRLLVLNRP